MTPVDPGRPRKSIVMVQGSTVGPVTKEAALKLVAEVADAKEETDCYKQVLAELRRILDGLETGPG